MNACPPRVFISYSHDSAEHKERVLKLAERLRADGIDATIDQYIENKGPSEGWPRWMDEQLQTCDFILLICTATYRRRVEGHEDAGRGHGVAWEGNLVYQHLYNAASRNEKFLPVLLEDGSMDDIPMPLQGVPSYSPFDEAGYEAMYRRLTGQPFVNKGQLGTLRSLPSRKITVGPLEKSSSTTVRPVGKPLWIVSAVLVAIAAGAIFMWIRRMPYVYSVRVSVVDAQGRSVEDAQVTSSLGGEPLHSDMGWQFTIPASSRPADGKLVVRAAVPAAYQHGDAELKLGRANAISATIQLHAAADVRVRGIVVGESQDAIQGVRVTVVGFEDHALTSTNGAFSLPAHVGEGQQVQIHAQKEGYRATDLWHPAGETPAVLVLQKAPQ